MIVLITLTIAGADSGPYDLYSNVDGYTVPFETGVSKLALVSGYTSVLVPNGTATIKVQSTGVCTNYVLIPVAGTTTTTSSTTSTSTTLTPTTTSTTTTINPCAYYVINEFGPDGNDWSYQYNDCTTDVLITNSGNVGDGDLPINICAKIGTVFTTGNCVSTNLGDCPVVCTGCTTFSIFNPSTTTNCTFEYTTCLGFEQTITIYSEESILICACDGTPINDFGFGLIITSIEPCGL